MSPSELLSLAALVGAFAGLGLVLTTGRTILRVGAHAEEVRRRLVRAAEQRAEAARLTAIRSETVAGAVDLGSAVARLGHETVAGLSFRLLDVATRGRTRSFKQRHDSIANAIYGAISEATGELRHRGGASGATPAGPAGLAGGPPGRTPPALPPAGPADPAGPDAPGGPER